MKTRGQVTLIQNGRGGYKGNCPPFQFQVIFPRHAGCPLFPMGGNPAIVIEHIIDGDAPSACAMGDPIDVETRPWVNPSPPINVKLYVKIT